MVLAWPEWPESCGRHKAQRRQSRNTLQAERKQRACWVEWRTWRLLIVKYMTCVALADRSIVQQRAI